jgi:predicted N-acetyltransferase YhbS
MLDLPELPGVTLRPYTDADDLAAMVAVMAGREAHDAVDPYSEEQRTPTLDELAGIFAPRPGFDPAHQILVAEASGGVVGFAWIRAWAQDETTWVCYHRHHLLPQWRGQGIGAALLQWSESTLRQGVVPALPDGARAYFRTNATNTERETVARLVAHGYTVANRTVELALNSLAALPAPVVPDGFAVRPPRPREYRAIYFANEAAFADEWGHIAKTDEDFATFIDDVRTDPSLWRVAWDGDEIAGVVMGEMGRFTGVIGDLSVGSRWRQRGLGRALLLCGLLALRERGATEARIYTDAADPFGALTLYTSVGFHPVKEYLRFVKEF